MKTRLTTVLSVALAAAIPLIDADIAPATGFVVRELLKAGDFELVK
ncbi:MAG: hypothetical protein WA849_05430 [Candidatus Udaeobacter sp.]